MKDKRKILKVASILEFMYIGIAVIYYILTIKSIEEIIANVFLLSISASFSVIVYKLSLKDINELKNKQVLLTISSIWLLFDIIVPGVLGLYFIRTLSEKKKKQLPVINESKITSKDKIKSILLLILFFVLMYVIPEFKFYDAIPSYIVYLLLFSIVLFANYKELIIQLKIYMKNIKLYLPYVIKKYFKMLGLMIIIAFPIILINGGNTSNNQESINVMFEKVPLITLILTCLYAPFVEELLFRFSLSRLINNKKAFILLSGFIFGLLHVLGQFSNFKEFLFVFQYSVLGICLAKAYKETNNIFVSISMHFMQNFLASMLILLLF